jgi:hypothetical protein
MIVGIDYGTTTTQVSYLAAGGIPDLMGIGQGEGYEKYTVRSVISLGMDGGSEVVIGDAAVEKKGRVILPSLKRCLRCSFNKSTGVGRCTNPPNKRLCAGLGKYEIGGQIYSVEKLIGLFFHEVEKSIPMGAPRSRISLPLSDIRLSVPPMYDKKTIRRLSGAVEKGLNAALSPDIKYEPTSALATLIKKEYLEDGTHVVCDIGGGTTDLAMIQKIEEKVFLLEPQSLMVGGNDLDQCLFDYLHPRLKHNAFSDAELMGKCRVAKERLSSGNQTDIGQIHVTRSQFENLIFARVAEIADFLEEYIQRQLDSLEKKARGRTTSISVHLVGGGSRVPLIKSRLSALRFEGIRLQVRPVKGRDTSDVYGDDFPVFCIALGNVLDFEDFNLVSLPVEIVIRRYRTTEAEIPSHSEFPVEFTVNRGSGVDIIARRGTREFDLMASKPCKPPITARGQHLPPRPETVSELLQTGNCRFKFMPGGSFRVEVVGKNRWFTAPWKNKVDETKRYFVLINMREKGGFGSQPQD